MDFWRLRSAGLLAALCLGLPAAQAYAPNSGSAVAGDLDAIAGPYGIPADKFQAATSSADASAAFYVTEYNVSSSSSMGNSPVAVTGWKLTARVKTDVSLSDASSGDEGTIAAKQNKTQATTLYVEAPDGMTMGAQWRLCAVVYPGTTTTAAVDGTCKGVLSTECIQALTASAGASGPTGMDEQGNCSNFELPSRCTDSFPDGSGNLSAISGPFLFFLLLSLTTVVRNCCCVTVGLSELHTVHDDQLLNFPSKNSHQPDHPRQQALLRLRQRPDERRQ